MEVLLKRRRHLKGCLTKLLSRVANVQPNSDQIEGLTQQYNRHHDGFIKVYEEIMEKCEDEEFDTYQEEYDEQTDRFLEVLTKLTTLQRASETAVRSVTPESIPSGQQAPPTEVRLPSIELPTFDGELRKWNLFSELFQATIVKRADITDGQKLHYLKGALKGEAANLIDTIPIETGSFADAWSILEERFLNKRLLRREQIVRLYQCPNATEDCKSLQRLIDWVKQCKKSLKCLGEPVEHWDAILNYLVEERLDKELLREWSLSIKDHDEPKNDDFITFLEVRAQTRAMYEANTTISTSSKEKKETPEAKATSSRCPACKGEHIAIRCDKFLRATIPERQELVKNSGLCINCLRSSHSIKNCPSRSCKNCGRRHHTMLHQDRARNDPDVQPTLTTMSRSSDAKLALMSTALVEVTDHAGHRHDARAVVDSGAHISLITEALLKKLKLKTNKVSNSLSGLGSADLGRSTQKTTLTVRSRVNPKETFEIPVLVVKNVMAPTPERRFEWKNWPHLNQLDLADPTFNYSGTIDVLLGLDAAPEFMMSGVIIGPRDTPMAQNSKLGWLLSGRISTQDQHQRSHKILLCTELATTLQRFWELEAVPECHSLSPEEKLCVTKYSTTTTRTDGGRYVVDLPLTENAKFGESRSIAVSRMQQLERKFQKNPSLQTRYADVMTDYTKSNHIEPVPEGQRGNPSVYLPHHAVVRESSSTTKVRVVFDASAKTGNGRSLNDNLMNGPKTQGDLSEILLRFRSHAVAISADIKQMFRQILVKSQDCDYQRIVWRESPTHPMRDFRLRTITFGTKSAPFLATQTIIQLAADEGHRFPAAGEVLRRDFYVDDLMTGADTTQQALNLQKEIIGILETAKFELHKWASNDSQVMAATLPSHRQEDASCEIAEDNTVSTLGLHWRPRRDVFVFAVNMPNRKWHSKRSLLSDTARIFDPLGWISPVIIIGKIYFQELWRLSENWDDPLPAHIKEKWIQFLANLPALTEIQINRRLSEPNANSYVLCGFCDASERAYAAVVYLRIETSQGKVITKLVAAKTRVSPLKFTTIPRLELCAGVLLSRLLTAVKASINLPIAEIIAWTDSTVVLAWLRDHPCRWKTFVANRVAEIQDHLPSSTWRHVKGDENPADCASRGLHAHELRDHKLWWSGPSFLKESNFKDTNPQTDSTPSPAYGEERKAVVVLQIRTDSSFMERFSNFQRLLRATAYVLRFLTPPSNPDKHQGPLSAPEIAASLSRCIKLVQGKGFPKELSCLQSKKPLDKSSPIRQLAPFLDQDEILRVGGRLHNSELPYDQKHPILLPRCHLSTLLVEHIHRRDLHAGPLLMLSTLRQQYWILKARDLIRKVVHNCVKCCRIRGQCEQTVMADLPRSRSIPGRPFQTCGVDYAGPLTLRSMLSRGSKHYKGYTAVFVCFVTKAVHLEVVSNLTTAAFLAAFKRFVARRGRPSHIYSDNGTNFVGANKELKELQNLYASENRNTILAQELANLGTEWHFNPPAAPHFGGLWEAAVKSMKFHLKRIVGSTPLNFEEMATVLAQIEACLNSRPLCAISSDPHDFTALTPGHFLTGAALTAPPEPDLQQLPINRLSRWQIVQQMTQHFWRRWASEYLTALQHRTKWTAAKPPVKIGDLVILRDQSLAPQDWQLGRVLQVHQGKDGHVRVIQIHTQRGTYTRPVVQICKLPVEP